MQKKIRVELDTSDISALFDDGNPDRQYLTKWFFDEIESFKVYISDVVLVEIDAIKESLCRSKLTNIAVSFEVLSIDEETRKLPYEYVKHGVIPDEYSEDALHIAISTLNKIDYLLSWNFRHGVKIKTRRIVNMVNLFFGYTDLNIATPAELI